MLTKRSSAAATCDLRALCESPESTAIVLSHLFDMTNVSQARDLRARLMPQGYCALESFSIMLRRRYALHRRALVRLHAMLREGFFERWAPPPSLYQRPVMSNHDPAAVASTAHARRVRLLDALEDLSATDDEEDSQVWRMRSQ